MLVSVNLHSVSKEVKPGTGAKRRGPSRREAIFEAALRSFRERGFHATSINDIGAASGITGPAIYRHFSSKEEVLGEAIREGTRRIAAATYDAMTSEDLGPAEALEALVRAYVRVALENADIFTAFMLEARHLGDEFRKPLRRKDLRHREGGYPVPGQYSWYPPRPWPDH